MKQTLAVTLMNLRAIPQRLGTSLVIVIGIAGVVAVLVSVLAMAVGLPQDRQQHRPARPRPGTARRLPGGDQQQPVTRGRADRTRRAGHPPHRRRQADRLRRGRDHHQHEDHRR